MRWNPYTFTHVFIGACRGQSGAHTGGSAVLLDLSCTGRVAMGGSRHTGNLSLSISPKLSCHSYSDRQRDEEKYATNLPGGLCERGTGGRG